MPASKVRCSTRAHAPNPRHRGAAHDRPSPTAGRPQSCALGAAITRRRDHGLRRRRAGARAAPAVREELAKNPDLMKTLEAYLKTKEALAHALDPILVATIPERLAGHHPRARSRASAGTRPRGPAQVRRWRAPVRQLPHAAARRRRPLPDLPRRLAWRLRDAPCQSATRAPRARAVESREVSSLSRRCSGRSKGRRAGRRPKLSDRLSIEPRCHASLHERDLVQGVRPASRRQAWAAARSPAAAATALGSSRCPGRSGQEYNVAGGSGAQGQSPPIDLGNEVLDGVLAALSGTVVGRDKERDLIARRWRETP